MIISDNDTKLSGRITKDAFSMQPTFISLSALGWDPRHGHCHRCQGEPAVFVVRSQDFLCADHASGITFGAGEVVSLQLHG